MPTRRLRRRAAVLLAGATAALTLAACGSSEPPDASGSGPVDVLYAGSLVGLMQNQVGPGFKAATGYTVTGFAGGSSALATQITGKVRTGDVFISASPAVNTSLQGSANGNWVSWYASYASSALVLGYNPKSRFAADLKSEPWYQVVTEPGFRLGMTDPTTDPKGALSAQALTDTAAKQGRPALATLAGDKADTFPEETLIGRLQAGQLDAGFFYNSEAVAAEIPTVPLTGVALRAVYTVTVLNRAPHEKGAEAFVKYLLGPAGRAALTKDGYTLISPPTVTGTGVPSGLTSVLSGK